MSSKTLISIITSFVLFLIFAGLGFLLIQIPIVPVVPELAFRELLWHVRILDVFVIAILIFIGVLSAIAIPMETQIEGELGEKEMEGGNGS